jgi:phage portal protein BeeE/phage FluMu protein Com
MLSMQAFRNGEAMDDPPRLVVRPDPDEAPGTFYATTAANLAKHGEYVWYIASFDDDGNAAALVNVPLYELHVDANAENRRRPRYQWGKIESTRWTPTNRTGRFVHRKYALNDPLSLRGEGPLQMAKAAVSIAVESQTWAANFFGDGGFGRDVVKYAGYLDPTLKDEQGVPDPDNGLSEADRFRAQYMSRDNNVPIIIDQAIDSITHPTIDPETAQMMLARLHQRGDAALMFGIPGKFAEYVQSGTSLTYQTLESALKDLVVRCLQPLYLEPIEQDMSDLQTRTTVTRFNVKGFLRADPKTRAEVYNLLIPLGVMTIEQAQQEEGYVPGDVEYAPVPFSPVQPAPIRAASMQLTTDWRCSGCGKKLLDVAGPGSVATCARCKTRNEIAASVDDAPVERRLEIHNHFPADFVRVENNLSVPPPRRTTQTIERDDRNNIIRIVPEEEPDGVVAQ